MLLEEGWRELFVLSAAQFMLPLEMATLLAAAGISSLGGVGGTSGSESSLSPNSGAASDKLVTLMTEIRCFQELIAKMKEMQVDLTEYACLKAIVLFKTGKSARSLLEYARLGRLIHAFNLLAGPAVFPTANAGAPSANCHELRDVATVAVLQDQAQLTLSNYISARHPRQQAFRFGKLLLMLPTLRAISENTIEEIFFRKAIGNTTVVRLLTDMYKSSEF